MYPVTNTVKTLLETEQPQLLRVTGTDSNNVAISITDADVMYGGFSIDRYSCNSQKLEIGTAVAAELTLKLNNTGGTFDSLRFEGSELYVEVGVVTGPSTTYWIPCGYFIVDEQTRKLNTITIKALDRMMMLDFELPVLCPWTDNNGNYITDNNGNVLFFNSGVAFPNTVQGMVNQICIMSGLTLGTNISSFPNASYSISSAPAVPAGTTLRDYIQWAAALMGTCAYIDWQGKLCFGWYASASYTSTASNRFDSDLYENDITITGVTYTDEANNQYIAGTKGYTIDLTRNYLIGSNISTVLSAINTAINGFTYRPFSAVSMPAPYLWPMDVITFVDKDNVSHNCAVTNVNLTINDSTKLKGRGETEKTNSYARISSMTAEQALAMQRAAQAASKEVQNLNNSLTQQEIFDRLTDGGLEQGIALEQTYQSLGAAGDKKVYLNMDYARFGQLMADRIAAGAITADKIAAEAVTAAKIATGAITADMITAGTMSANRIQGGTLTLGGQNNQDGQIALKDSGGTQVGTWDNDKLKLGTTNDFVQLYGNATYNGVTSKTPFYAKQTYNSNTLEMMIKEAKLMLLRGVYGLQLMHNSISLTENSGNGYEAYLDIARGYIESLTNGDFQIISDQGYVDLVGSGVKVNGTAGKSGTFTANGHTLTITNGIITNIT